jgi:DNA-binding NarL/FixJ family response regulator
VTSSRGAEDLDAHEVSDARDARDARDAPKSVDGKRLTVLAIVEDEQTRALLPRVLAGERLIMASDPVRGLAFAETEAPDIVFVDIRIGSGAGLAMIHHLKAAAPETQVFAMSTTEALEAGAHAVALGGAGLLLLPLGGDEILSAVGAVKIRLAERAVRAELEQQIGMSARAAGWVARMAELAGSPDRAAAAQRIADVVREATGASAAIVYAVGESGLELGRLGATSGFEGAPASATEPELLGYAHRERLVDVQLTLRESTIGHVLLENPEDIGAPGSTSAGAEASPVRRSSLRDGLLKLLATQAAAALALHNERERLRGIAAMKDATSSAYSFAYYVDIAGREIYKATRYGRRLSLVVIGLDQGSTSDPERAGGGSFTATTAADRLLTIAPDMAVLARVDDAELHLLLPETNGLGAHAARRKALTHLGQGQPDKGLIAPRGVLAGVATFPHDGQDLLKLQRVARRRAEESRFSTVHALDPEHSSVSDILDGLERAAATNRGPLAPKRIELPMGQAAALTSVLLAEALRGGGVHAVVTYHPEPNLFSTVRYMLGGGPRPGVTFRALDVRNAPDCATIEAVCVVAEQGAYALIGHVETGIFRGAHTSDPLIVDTLADRIGRAAGIRLFG